MTARTLMRVLAVYYILVLGAVWLAAPRSSLGHDHSAYALFVARVLGADLVIIGIMNWLISSQQQGAAASGHVGQCPDEPGSGGVEHR